MIFNQLTKLTAIALLFAGLGFASCSKDDSGTTGGNNDYDRVVTGAQGYYAFAGGSDVNTGAYTIYIATATLGQTGWTGPGEVYAFALYSDVPADVNAPIPTRGTYNFDADNTHADNTFSAEGSSTWSLSSGSGTATGSSSFSAGKLTLRGTDANIIVEGEVTLTNGTTVKLNATSLSYLGNSIEIGDLERDVQMQFSFSNGGVLTTEDGSYDVYGNNTTSYIIYCYDATSNQVRLQLNLIGEGTAEGERPALAAGTYTIANETTAGTCLAGSTDLENISGSFYDASGLTGEVGWLTNGTITVSGGEGLVYTIDVQAQTNLGHSVTGLYKGGVILNGGNPTPTTTLTADVETNFPDVTKGLLRFYGDQLDNGLGYTIIDLQPNGGNQPGFVMAILLADPDARELTKGTYAVTNDYSPNMLYPGMISGNNEFEPSAYYVTDAQNQGTTIQAPIQAGSVELTRGEGDTWQITIDAYDDANNHISGYWSGSLTAEN